MKKMLKLSILLLVVCLSLTSLVACGIKWGGDGGSQDDGKQENISITNAKLDADMNLVLTFSDDTTKNLGKVQAEVDENLHLILTLPDGKTVDAGKVEIDLPDNTVTYTVTFKDYDGTTLKTEQVAIGQDATAPADPAREGYRFSGWDAAFDTVTSDLVVTAEYVKQVTVTFKDYNGTTLKTQTIDQNTVATAPANPTRAGYVFNGWDKSFSRVSADTTVTATYLVAVDAPTIQVEEVTAKASATNVAVKVLLRKNPGVSSIVLNVDYDKSALALTNYTINSALGGTPIAYDPAATNITLPWSNFSASNVSDDLVYATMYFTVHPSASQGLHNITVSYDADNVLDMNDNNVTFDVIVGGITVTN